MEHQLKDKKAIESLGLTEEDDKPRSYIYNFPKDQPPMPE